MAIYTLRTTSGREDIVADMMMSKVRAESLDVRVILHPAELKGYVFIEGGLGDIHKAIHGMLHIRGLIEKPIKMEEIQHFFGTKKARIVVDKEDVVEIIGGPFKGEKGKIQRIDKAKDEVTVELLEASVPIPVTIATEFVKLVKRSKSRKAKEEEAKPAEKPADEQAREEEGLPGADEIREGVSETEKKPAEKPGESKKPDAPEEEKSIFDEIIGVEEKAESPEPGPAEEKPEEKKKEFEAPKTQEETEALTAPVIPQEPEKPKEEAPAEKKPEEPEKEKLTIKPDEPVIMESEEELETPVIPQEPEKKEEPEAEEEPGDSLLADLEKEKKKKKKSPEDLEEGG